MPAPGPVLAGRNTPYSSRARLGFTAVNQPRTFAGVELANRFVPDAWFQIRLFVPLPDGATEFTVCACTTPYAASLITSTLPLNVPAVVLLYSSGYLPVVCSVSRNAPVPTNTV